MRWKRSFALVLLVVLMLCGCASTGQRPRVQSPQCITPAQPPLDPPELSPVKEDGAWCALQFQNQKWFLCNIHYHRPAEHGGPCDRRRDVIPPCAAAETDTGPLDWIEIHYVYVPSYERAAERSACAELRTLALKTTLGVHCREPFIVRSVWAKVTATGTFQPKASDLPDSARYVEYDGSNTGPTGGTFPAHWKINRDCLAVTEDALTGVHEDEPRELQPPPEVGKPKSTKDQ